MTTDNIIKILDEIVKLLSAFAWPIVVLFVIVLFGPTLRGFIANIGEFSLKGGQVEATFKRRQAEAAAALGVAVASRPEDGASPESAATHARQAAELVAEVVTPRVIRRAGTSTVLWVDDNPDNNIHERQSLAALGVTFVIARSTEEAIEQLKSRSFDAIISDMRRPGDSQAGYTLLERLRAGGNLTPFIIYAGSRKPEDQAEARRRGAVGCTNRPDDLFQMVLSELGRWREPQGSTTG